MLSRWDQDEGAEGIREAITLAAKAGVSFLKNGMQLTMNLYNIKSRPKKPAAIDKTEETGDADAV